MLQHNLESYLSWTPGTGGPSQRCDSYSAHASSISRVDILPHGLPHTYCDRMAVVKMACGHTRPKHIYGFFVILLMVGLDLLLISFSYRLILQAVVHLNSLDVICKALNICSAHFFVILVTYASALFSSLTRCIDHNIPPLAHVLLANL